MQVKVDWKKSINKFFDVQFNLNFIWFKVDHVFHLCDKEHLQQCSACNPTQIFFSSKFSYLILCNTTHKTEIGIANRCGTTNSEPPGANHYDMPIRNTEQQSDHIYYTLLWRCTALLRIWQATRNFAIMLSQNNFSELNQHILPFFIKFYCADHIWSTAGDALRREQMVKCDPIVLSNVIKSSLHAT